MAQELASATIPPTIKGDVSKETRFGCSISKFSNLLTDGLLAIFTVPVAMVIAIYGVFGTLKILGDWQSYHDALDYYRTHSPATYPQVPDIPFVVYLTAPPVLVLVLIAVPIVLISLEPSAVSAPVYPPAPRTSTLYGGAERDKYIDTIRALRGDEISGDERDYED